MACDIPRISARWVLAVQSHGSEHVEIPIKMMLGKSFTPRFLRALLIIPSLAYQTP